MSKKPKLVLCRNCNTPITKNAKICPSCGAKNKKPFFKRWWFVLLVVILVLGGIGSINRNKKEKFDWNEVELCDRLPKPKSNVGRIWSNEPDRLSIEVEKTSKSEYKNYVKESQAMGYTIESEESGDSYKAFDEEGYGLSVSYFNESMDIELEAPTEMGTLNWPKSEIAGLLPLPKSTVGKVSTDTENGCYIYVGETSIDDFNAATNMDILEIFDNLNRQYDMEFLKLGERIANDRFKGFICTDYIINRDSHTVTFKLADDVLDTTVDMSYDKLQSLYGFDVDKTTKMIENSITKDVRQHVTKVADMLKKVDIKA